MNSEEILKTLDELAASLEQTLVEVNAARDQIRCGLTDDQKTPINRSILHEWWANLPA